MPTSINNSEDQPENRNLKALTRIRLKNRNRPIIGQLNINSIRNKFDFFCSKISPHLDLLLDSETKLDNSFPTALFVMSGFCKPYRLDRCSNGGGLLLFIREDLRSCLLTGYKPSENVECIFVEIKDTHRENTPSNKSETLTKSMNMYIWAIGILNQLFMRGSYA